MRKIANFIIICLLFMSCGTTLSLHTDYVPYAIITVSDSLTVQGMLINETDTTVSISVDGANVVYNLDEITRYERVMKPNPQHMQEDIVKNTNATAGNTAFFVVLTVISIVAVVILQVTPK